MAGRGAGAGAGAGAYTRARGHVGNFVLKVWFCSVIRHCARIDDIGWVCRFACVWKNMIEHPLNLDSYLSLVGLLYC